MAERVTHRAGDSHRDLFLDAVRAIAVVRVVGWHTYGWAPITWVIAAVPAMFFVSGHLLATSFDRRAPWIVVRNRLRRLLLPFWGFGLAAWVVMATARRLENTPETALPWRGLVWWVIPFNDPHGSEWEGGWLSQPLWYVRSWLWLLLLAPLLYAAARRAPVVVLGVLITSTVGLDLVHRHASWHDTWAPNLLWRAGDITLYAVFLVLGFLHARVIRLHTRLALVGSLIAIPTAIAVALVARPEDGIVNNSHVLHLVVGGGWLALALALRGPITALAARRGAHAGVAAIGRRSLSIYLWHSAMVITTWHLLTRQAPLPRGVHSALLGLGTVIGTLCVVVLVGPIEDLAARRSRRARIGARRVARAGMAAGVLAVVAAFLLPATTRVDRPLLGAPRTDGGASGTEPAAPSATAVPSNRSSSRSAPVAPRVPSRAPSVRIAEQASERVTPTPSGASADDGVGTETETDTDLPTVISRWQNSYSSSGLSVGVARPGSWDWVASPYGGSGGGTFDVESITKTVTASAVWLLVADGVVTIDGPVPPLAALPELASRGLTVRHLLEHRSGIPDYHDLETPEDVGEDPAVTVVRSALAAPPDFEPGTARVYSSTNYLILGLVIEERTGQALDDVLWGRVLDPAGVGELFFRASSSVWQPGGGAGGLISDMHGLLAWGTALLRDHRPVGEAIWNNMTQLDGVTSLGAGLMGLCPCDGGFLWVGHTGGTTALFYDRRDNVLVAARIANGIWGGFEDPFYELVERLRVAALLA